MRRNRRKIIVHDDNEDKDQRESLYPEIDDMISRIKWELNNYLNPWNETREPMKRLLHTDDYLPVDIADEGSVYIVYADLPGVKKDRVMVRMEEDGEIVISVTEGHDDMEEEMEYVLRERTRFRSKRSLRFPEEIKEEGIHARLTDGVLRVEIPKKRHVTEKTMKIIVE
jgi:HSP20 family protein